jgi:hypothetical protein
LDCAGWVECFGLGCLLDSRSSFWEPDGVRNGWRVRLYYSELCASRVEDPPWPVGEILLPQKGAPLGN